MKTTKRRKKTVNKLKEAIVYLSGPIDKAADLGKGWREGFIKKARHLKILKVSFVCQLALVRPLYKRL